MNIRGRRFRLTRRIDSLGVSAHPGDEGTVTEVHCPSTDETGVRYQLLTARMDNGRTQFPSTEDLVLLPAADGARGC